ncbi:MAG: hypothetical protein GY794_00875 [bacterium]|nr:hypothetical protein [bacterium]
MKNVFLGTLAVTFAVVCGRALGADKAAKIVDEKVLFTVSKDVYTWGKAGFRSMRLSPDGTKLLFARHQGDYSTGYYQFVLRDIKAGTDKVLEIAGHKHGEFVAITLSGKVFDPAGKRLAIGAGIDTNKNGQHDIRGQNPEKMQAVIYDLATGKITKKIGPTAMLVMTSFDRTGNGLVLGAMNRPGECKMYFTPVDKIKLRELDLKGLPRGICPMANVMAVRQFPGMVGGKRVGHRMGLFDLVTGKMGVYLPLRERNSIDDYGPHWTVDGRHLYYVGTDRQRDRNMKESRIWDRTGGKELASIPYMLPVGPGPTATTMILTPHPKRNKLVVHDALAGKTWPVTGAKIKPICSEGKYIIYVKRNKEGKDVLYRGQIKLPGL